MRAAIVRGPGSPADVELADLPVPEPGEGQVLLGMRAAGLGPWDVKSMAGSWGEVPNPYVIGFEFAGMVEALGPGVEDLEVGDEVYGTDWRAGSIAEKRVVAVADAARKPARMTFEEAVALPVAGCTSLEGLVERGRLTAGETVLVTAASGGVGTIAVQLAVAQGARVLAVCSRENHAYALELGADRAFDYHDGGWAAQVREATAGKGVDLLFDCAGGDTLAAALTAVRDGGRAIGIVFGGPQEAPPGISFERFSAASGRERLARLAEIADEGRLRVELAAQLPLDHVVEALERVASGHTRGKVVVTIP